MEQYLTILGDNHKGFLTIVLWCEVPITGSWSYSLRSPTWLVPTYQGPSNGFPNHTFKRPELALELLFKDYAYRHDSWVKEVLWSFSLPSSWTQSFHVQVTSNLSNGIAITFKRFIVEAVELHVLQIDQGHGQPADLVHFPDIDEVSELWLENQGCVQQVLVAIFAEFANAPCHFGRDLHQPWSIAM